MQIAILQSMIRAMVTHQFEAPQMTKVISGELASNTVFLTPENVLKPPRKLLECPFLSHHARAN